METVEYLKILTNTPSPTGYSKKIISLIDGFLKDMAYETSITNKGGLLVTVAGQNNTDHRMVTAHLDTLGAMVKGIKEDGRLIIEKIGGFHYNSIEGENCLIHLSLEEKTYSGTVLLHQNSVHVYDNAASAERNQENMEIRIDEKVMNREDTLKLGIEVGDFISFDPRTLVTESGYIKSRHLDDKVSCAIMLSMLEKISTEDIRLPYTTHFYFSNNEEIGYGANSNIPKEVKEYLAVDMGALGDGQASDEYTVSICAKDSSGPYNMDLRNHLVRLARDNKINYRLDIYPHYGSDASAALRAGADIKHGLIGAGIESSHAYERTHISSIVETEKLLRAYLLSEML
ncbi:M42 family metallopeptidase [Peptoniphilaceae bacterium SGI.131]